MGDVTAMRNSRKGRKRQAHHAPFTRVSNAVSGWRPSMSHLPNNVPGDVFMTEVMPASSSSSFLQYAEEDMFTGMR